MILSQLRERVLEQLNREYHDPARAKYEFDNLTAPRLLEMLAYMELDDED